MAGVRQTDLGRRPGEDDDAGDRDLDDTGSRDPGDRVLADTTERRDPTRTAADTPGGPTAADTVDTLAADDAARPIHAATPGAPDTAPIPDGPVETPGSDPALAFPVSFADLAFAESEEGDIVPETPSPGRRAPARHVAASAAHRDPDPDGAAPSTTPAAASTTPSPTPTTPGPTWRSPLLNAWRSPRQQWAVAAVLVLLAAVLRLWNLGEPAELVFDETYYVKDGWTLINLGYEADWIGVEVEDKDKPDEDLLFESGDTGAYDPDDPSYIVHPPVGKYVIGLGMVLLGADDPVGWRISVALLGIGVVLITTRAATRLTRSTTLGALAGFLVAIDGQGIVHSRTSLLDGPLTFFLVAAFAALLIDRDQARERLARAVAAPGSELWGRWGPRLGLRPWRWVAGLMLAAAVSTKWSGLYFLAAWGLLTVGWDLAARRRAGLRWWPGLVLDGVPAFVALVGTTAVGYVASWTGWLRSSGGWGRQWALEHPGEGVQWLPEGLRSLLKYHENMWSFHTGLTSEHSYQAHPAGWLIQYRPTSFFYRSPEPALEVCGAEKCSAAILAIGNPLIWWAATAAVLVALWWVLRRADGVAWAPLTGLAAGWLPWFAYAERPIFTFYAIVFLPYLVMVLAWVAGRLWDDAGLVRYPPPEGTVRPVWVEGWRGGVRTARCWVDEDRRTAIRAVMVTALVVVALVSAFYYPIWTAQPVPVRFWQLHIWMPSWK